MNDPDRSIVAMFMRVLAVDERVANALVVGEITTVEEVAYIPLQELLEIEALDKALIPSLRARAREYLLRGVMGDSQ